METALKDMYNKEFLRTFANIVQAAYSTFDSEGFIVNTMDDTWTELKLKERMRRITKTLGQYLPKNYKDALAILFAIDESCIGFPYLFFPDFVEVYGQADEDWDLSMKALERFTIRSSSEFAVRPFLKRNPEIMIAQMLVWTQSENEHVRRLSSEGCRPRLPWGEALNMYKTDPKPIISILEQLKEDSSLYVRKSVANNLNDISKDNPSLLIEKIREWKGKNSNTDWILRHGARSLIRKADSQIMKLYGYDKVTASANLSVSPKILKIGDSSEIKYEVSIEGDNESHHIRIEYGIYFVKARGITSRKLFLLSDKTVAGGTCLSGKRLHWWKELTTRRHYPGEHRIVLVLNGCEIAETTLKLEC